MAIPTLIYCLAGNPRHYAIAVECGFRYGARLPGTVYGPLYFADQDFKHPDRARYMANLAHHRPIMATVLDWEREEQFSEVLSWGEEAAQYCEHVVIVPKVQGGIARIPRRIGGRNVVLGYSVPTRYAGTELPIWDFAGWPVHLLGGSPHGQMRLWRYLSVIAEVVSADGNMANKMSQRCSFWSQRKGPKGHWDTVGSWGTDANNEAFRRSCVNIMDAWRSYEN